MAAAAGTVSRANAYLDITTDPLGQGTLIPVALRGEETISAPFRFVVEVISARDRIDPDAVLYKPLCVAMRKEGKAIRHVHGIVQRFSSSGPARRDMWGYRAEIVPRLWFLGQTEDCRVFQNKTSVQIIGQLLQDARIENVDYKPYGTVRKREYTIQYNETDLDFVTRLMQEDGLFYFFVHSQSDHRLVIAGANAACLPVDRDEMVFVPSNPGSPQAIATWQPARATAFGSMTLDDFDPTAPTKALAATSRTSLHAGGADLRDSYRWTARTTEQNEVSLRAGRRMAAAEDAVMLATGTGFNETFTAGGKFRLANDPAGGSAYIIRRVSHHASDDTLTTGAGGASYSNEFSAFDAATPWREPLPLAHPAMAGVHSATVIGPAGEEIYTDDLGRVKVRFRWDHRKEATAEGSCWVRVVQPWAGNGWGAQFLPRVGTEVCVAFLESDPERPVVLGGLFNGDDKPIYPKTEKTKSGLRTRSSQGGGSADFSELTFDDKKGQELVFLHAQKDHTVEVENDQSVSIQGKETVKIDKGRTTTIAQGGDALTVQSGDISIKASTGAISIEALTSITLKVGQNSVKVDQSGVTINGLKVEVKGVMTTVNGDAMLTLKGGVIMAN